MIIRSNYITQRFSVFQLDILTLSILLISALFVFDVVTRHETNQIIKASMFERQSGVFNDIYLPKYKDSHAISLKKIGATLAYRKTIISDAKTTLTLRFFDHGDYRENRLRVSIDDVHHYLSLNSKAKGFYEVSLPLTPNSVIGAISIELVHLEQPSLVFDEARIVEEAELINKLKWFLVFLCIVLSSLITFTFLTKKTVIQRPSQGTFIASLTGLRSFAVILVLLLHSSGFSNRPQFDNLFAGNFFNTLVYNGYYGVEIFYVLSAFTLTLSFRYLTVLNIAKYYNGRIFRIIPLYFFVVLLCVCVRTWLIPSAKTLELSSVLATLGLIQVFNDGWLKGVIHHSVWWSVSTEFQFYLALPVVILIFKKLGNLNALILMLLSSLTLDAIFIDNSLYYLSFLNYLDCFSVGVFFARCRKSIKFTKRTYYFSAVFFFWLIYFSKFRDSISLGGIELNFELRQPLFALLVGYLIYILRHTSKSRFLSLFNSSAVIMVGTLSYGVYLIHVPIMNVVQKYIYPIRTGHEFQDYALMLLISINVSLLLSYYLHKYIELPFNKWGRNFGQKTGVLIPLYIFHACFFIFIVACLTVSNG